jgi:hypothetical protein
VSEYPDVTVYVERLAARAVGPALRHVQLLDRIVLRTALMPAAST